MEYRSLGKSGLKVSLHSLGSMNFSGEGFFGMAGQLSHKESQRLVDIAIDHGVNLFDTAIHGRHSHGKALYQYVLDNTTAL